MVGLPQSFTFLDLRIPRRSSWLEKCGVAFQLTNITPRMLMKEDRERGRDYLPREDRERFPEFHDLMQFEVQRARG